jgi:hypothetical protein
MTLDDYLRGVRHRAFRYGSHDCAQMAGRWVAVSTGRDVMADWHYDSLKRGMAALKARGFADHVAAASSVLPEIAVLQARPGDIAVVGKSLGIVTGEMIAVPDTKGYVQVHLTAASRAFRVE